MSTQSESQSDSGKRPFSSNPLDFVSTVLKSQFGNSEDFLAFERYFYYQTEEINSLKGTCEKLQTTVSKFQEEKRSMELQLLSEKSLRDQESKNSAMEIEKLNVQQNAQIYSMKCETESWKRKAEATATESAWLKEQMKTVEMEKNQAVQKLAEIKTSFQDFDRHRRSFEAYSRRQRALMQNVGKKLDELEKAREVLEDITDSNQKQLDMMFLQLRNWKDEKLQLARKLAGMEEKLMKAKAELAQGNSKLERAKMAEKKTAELVEQLMTENQDLQSGLAILANALGTQITEVDKAMVEKAQQLRTQLESGVKRLYLNST